jgi:hypothetical protein
MYVLSTGCQWRASMSVDRRTNHRLAQPLSKVGKRFGNLNRKGWPSCVSHRFPSCFESFVILHNVSGRTLRPGPSSWATANLWPHPCNTEDGGKPARSQIGIARAACRSDPRRPGHQGELAVTSPVTPNSTRHDRQSSQTQIGDHARRPVPPSSGSANATKGTGVHPPGRRFAALFRPGRSC